MATIDALYSAEELSTLGLVSDDGDPVLQSSSAIDASAIGTPLQLRTSTAPTWTLCPSGGYKMIDGGAAIVHVRSNAKAASLKKKGDERGDLAVGNPVVSHGVRCLELNYDDRSRVPSHAVIYALNNGSHGRIPVHHLKRPKGTAPNAWSMKRAVRASVLITELGTQWTDFPMEKRCALGRRSFVLAVAPHGDLLHSPVSRNSARVPQYGRTIPFSRGQDPSMNWCEQSIPDSGIAASYCPRDFSSKQKSGPQIVT